MTSIVLLRHCFANQVFMVDFEHTALVCGVECILEVFAYLLLIELFLYSIDDCHDSFDVFIEDVTFL